MNKKHSRTPSSTSTNTVETSHNNNNNNNNNNQNNKSSEEEEDTSSSHESTTSNDYNPFKHHTIIIPQPNNQIENENNHQNQDSTTSTTTIVIVLSSLIVSSISSIFISRLSTTLIQLPIITYPALEFLSLTIVTSVPQIINSIQSTLINHHLKPTSSNQKINYTTTPSTYLAPSNPSSPSPSSYHLNPFHTLPRVTKLRLFVKFTLPIALLNLITSWSKAHIAGQLSCSTWQAFDVYSLPLAFVVLDRLPSISQHNPQLFPIISIITFTLSLLIFNQSVYPAVILLALISASSQALYLIHLKTWLLSFPHLNPSHPLAYSSPFSLSFIIFATLFHTLFRSIHDLDDPIGWASDTNALEICYILLYTLIRLFERFIELWALHKFQSPLSVLLLIPARNLASIILSQFSSFYVDRLDYSSILVYVFSIWAICLTQMNTNGTTHHQFYRFLSSHSPLNPSNNVLTLNKNKKIPYHDSRQRGHRDSRRRSSTGGLMHHQDEYYLETIQEKPSHYDPLMKSHHGQKDRHHHQCYSMRDNQHDRRLVQGQSLIPIRFRKPFADRDLGYDRNRSNHKKKKDWRRFFQVLTFGSLPIMMILKVTLGGQKEVPVMEVVPGTVRNTGSVDLVFSYFNEPLHKFSAAVDYVRNNSSFTPQNPRVIVYVKHPNASLATIGMHVKADEVIRLENVGREGGTYLTHVLRHYNSSIQETLAKTKVEKKIQSKINKLNKVTKESEKIIIDENFIQEEDLKGTERMSTNTPITYGLADHTVFMQPEIAWSWIAKPRMNLFDPDSTGFLSFGPYLSSACGQDGRGNGNYERMRDIYTIFHDTFCPPTGQLASYAGQFVVSRPRILKNKYNKYKKMKDLLEAPIDHWIHREGGWLKWKGATDQGEPSAPVGPSAPFLGHALERSWPVIFHCTDPAIAKMCTDKVFDPSLCQCRD